MNCSDEFSKLVCVKIFTNRKLKSNEHFIMYIQFSCLDIFFFILRWCQKLKKKPLILIIYILHAGTHNLSNTYKQEQIYILRRMKIFPFFLKFLFSN